jgi:hypothetical protein
VRIFHLKSIPTGLMAAGIGFTLCMPSAALAQSSNPVPLAACSPLHTLTLTANSFARVYGNASDKAYVCLKSTGKARVLKGASASQDVFSLGGEWVAWTSLTHTTVTVMHITTGKIPSDYPYGVNDFVVKVVVKDDGAAAWAADVSDGTSYVQGFDRKHHSADTFSDDTKFVSGSSLKSLPGHAISWKYTDGSIGTVDLF